SDFEDVLRVFREDETALRQSSARAVAEIRTAQRAIVDGAQTRQAEQQSFVEATARLREIADRLANPAPATAADALAADIKSLAETLRSAIEGVRGEIRDMAIRLTEDRILSSAGSPFAEDGVPSATPMRSLADVPGPEIVARLKDLAAEMSAAQ